METFRGHPGEIAGLGNHTDQLADSLTSVRNYAGDARAGDGFTGLMGELVGPINGLQESFAERWLQQGNHVRYLSQQLRSAAWLYVDTDNHNRDLLAAHTKHLSAYPVVPPTTAPPLEWDRLYPKTISAVDDFPGAVSFGSPSPPNLPKHPTEHVNWHDLIAEVSGVMAEIDAKCIQYAGFSPLREVIEPVSGNWLDIKRIGATYGSSGDALDGIADDFDKSVRQIDPHWDGEAAQAFADYSRKTTAALRWEASAARLVGQALVMAAQKFSEAAQQILRVLKRKFEDFYQFDDVQGLLKQLTKKLPIVNAGTTTYQIANLIRTVAETVDKLKSTLEIAINDFKDFCTFVKDPVGYAEKAGAAKLDEKLKPITDVVAQGHKDWNTSKDVANVIDVSSMEDAPKGDYMLGEGDAPWKDGK